MRPAIRLSIIAVSLLLACTYFVHYKFAAASSTGPSFVEFESGQVRPLAMSADGQKLFAVNTPNGTLEVFDLSSGTPRFQYRVAVGLEPVAVAARTASEVWVVNHLSDSVSIVNLREHPPSSATRRAEMNPGDLFFPETHPGASYTT